MPATPSAIEYAKIGDLQPDSANPRRIDDTALEALTRSIQEFDFVDPVIARRADQQVIAGHQRLVAARRLGLETVPVIYVDLDASQARLLSLALNRIGGTWDEDLLARLLAELDQHPPPADLTLSGFTEDETRRLLRRLDAREKRGRPESFDPDAALDAVERQGAEAKPGDLWRLGDHRLLCGDATNPEHVQHLLDGQRAVVAFTDPPYNVAYGNHGGQARGRRKRRLANDAMPVAEWEAFVRTWAGEPRQRRERCPLRLHEHEGVARRLAHPRRGGRPLVGHDHLGEGPLRPGAGRLPTPVRTDLVWLARRGEAPVARRP